MQCAVFLLEAVFLLPEVKDGATDELALNHALVDIRKRVLRVLARRIGQK